MKDFQAYRGDIRDYQLGEKIADKEREVMTERHVLQEIFALAKS